MTSSLSAMRSNQLSYEPLRHRAYRRFRRRVSSTGPLGRRGPTVVGQPRTSSQDGAGGRPVLRRELRDRIIGPRGVKARCLKNDPATAHGAHLSLDRPCFGSAEPPDTRRAAHLAGMVICVGAGAFSRVSPASSRSVRRVGCSCTRRFIETREIVQHAYTWRSSSEMS